MRLLFVRHGESEANLARVFSNRGFKHPLTPHGIAQAQALAAHLAGQPIARIYSSPLQRAVQTADILSQNCGAPVMIADALREWDVGIYEGTSDQNGWEMHRQIQEDWFVRRQWDHRLPEGESLLEIQARFVPFIQQVIDSAVRPDDAIILVGHGGLYHAMLPLVLRNIDYIFVQQHQFGNAAYAVAETRPDGLYCREWCGMVLEHG